MTVNGFRLFLRLGDKVSHRDRRHWGAGVVVEEMTSIVPGGTCLVRILWQDGQQRTFNNDLDADMCCSHFGVRKLWSLDQDALGPPPRRRNSPMRRLRLPAR